MGTTQQFMSIIDASKEANVPVDLIERAVRNNFAVPIERKEPYRFSADEVAKWSHFDSMPSLIENRLQRDTKNEYRGRYIEPDEYSPRNSYILPFDQCWLVSDGGKSRTSERRVLSHHYYIAPCVRWSWDFVIIHPNDFNKSRVGFSTADLLRLRFRKGQREGTPDYAVSEPWEKDEYRKAVGLDSAKTSDHFCCGMDIISPAEGVIVTRGGLRQDLEFEEHIESAREAGDDRGLSFMIDHGNNEISQIAHILARTVAVKPGEKVEQGQVLCKAGAKQFMPHLHWGVWDNWHPLFAQSLPITISACLAYENGQFVEKQDVWLERGMLVGNIT